ncbi:MAG: 16S rRNA (adenine(1518)-N(6)/adenine(1519)-N(6))-dimethyltransferase RsmA [Azonexus sp.]|nr:16S rRNA (adenine(1518)-N(6)/adenine(1519)-N(6))-dimethyltransferase RsmA [Azonexus sp.]MCK6411761.1 16S rRNA (adenine(1518)-N(6)/adenine(1519)-N(6))-dimethyltransferase RsmA [Azonexus sp.]
MKKPVAGTSHVARKRFGQNFLVDRGIIDGIVSAVNPQAGETVVEIGPGLGALTEPLLQRVTQLHVVEIDRDLIARLRHKHPPERLAIHEGDALAFDFATIGTRLKLVGNLPYNISTPLLFHLANYAEQVTDMHFMLQKEVVERMVAEPGTADFGRLSVMLQYRFWLEWLLDVPPESFDPAPKVDSAVVRLIPKPKSELTAKSEQKLEQVVLAAFSQRRKMLRNTLKGVLDDAGFAALGIEPTERAENLQLADYIAIANYLQAG